MKKKVGKVSTVALASMAIVAPNVLAAIPNGTVLLGNKAFDLEYANNAANQAEITAALVGSGNNVYVKAFTGKWLDNLDPSVVIPSTQIPAVTYKSASGEVKNYASQDGEEIPVEADLTVTSVTPITKTVVSGTSADSVIAELPSKVTVTLSNDETKEVDVQWTAPANYDGAVAGTYEFEGELKNLPEGVTNANGVKAKAQVTVEAGQTTPDAISVSSVTAITDTGFKVTFSKEVTDADIAELKILNGETEVAFEKAIDEADKKVVNITLADKFYKPAVYTVKLGESSKQVEATVDAPVVDVTAAVAAVNAATTAEATKVALEENAVALGLDLTVYNTLQDSYKSNVATAVLNGKAIQLNGTYADAAAIKEAFDNAVEAQFGAQDVAGAVAAVNAVDAEAEDAVATVRGVLEANASKLGLELEDYSTLGTNGKNAVAQAVLTNKPEGGYADAAAVKGQFDTAVAAQKTALTNALDAVNSATDAPGMKAALEGNATALDLETGDGSDYHSLAASYQTAVAQAVLENRPEDDEATEANESGYANGAAVKAAFDAAVTAQKAQAVTDAIKAVNDATTVANTKTALESKAAALGLDLTAYNTLGSTYKDNVAKAVLDGKAIQAGGKYATAEKIKQAFDAAVNAQKSKAVVDAVAAVNNVTVADVNSPTEAEVGAMKTALENNAGLLGLVTGDESVYATLTNKNAVAQAVLVNRPQGGYADAAAIKAAFDAAVTAQKATEDENAVNTAVAAVNNAENATDMQTALEGNATVLGLETGEESAYNNLSTDGKTYVAQRVLDEKALEPDQTYASAAAIKTRFDAAVAYRAQVEAGQSVTTAIAAVNTAANADAMKTALENGKTVLELAIGKEPASSYDKLRSAFKSAVATAVLEAKPEGGYKTKASIQSAFNTAVTAQVEEQAKEDAAITAINNVAAAAQDATAEQIAAANAAMKAALEANAEELALEVGEGTDYDALSNGAKLEVAVAVFEARGEGFATGTTEGGAAAIKTAFDNEVAAQKALQANAVAAVNAATTVSAMKTAIDTYHVSLALDTTAYDNFSTENKDEVAQALIDGKLAQTGGNYADAVAIKAAFNAAVANVNAGQQTEDAAIAAVNGATAETMKSVLEANATIIGIDVTSEESEYADLGDTYKAAVAAKVLAVKPAEGGYTTLAAIKTAFDTAVQEQRVATVVDEVNNATTAAAVKAILENQTKAGLLNIQTGQDSAYANLSAEQKTTVATKVKDGKIVQPNGKYATAAAIKTVFNNAVSSLVGENNLATATTKVEALEAAVDNEDLSNDDLNAAAVNAKNEAQTAVDALSNGPDKTALQNRINTASGVITAADTAEGLVEAVEAASATAVTTTNVNNINAAKQAILAVSYTGTNTETENALEARVNAAKQSVASDPDFTFAVSKVDDNTIKVVVAGQDITSGFAAAGITFTVTNNYGGNMAVDDNGNVTVTLNTTSDAGASETITVNDVFWNKSNVKTVTITDSGDGVEDTFAVDND